MIAVEEWNSGAIPIRLRCVQNLCVCFLLKENSPSQACSGRPNSRVIGVEGERERETEGK